MEPTAQGTSFAFSLVVRGEAVDPDQISTVFKTQPTKQQRKGEFVVDEKLGLRHSLGMWVLESGRLPEADAAFQFVTSKVLGEPQAVREVGQKHTIEALFWVYPEDPDVSFHVTPELAKWLSDRNILLRVHWYNFTVEEAKEDLAGFFDAMFEEGDQ